MHGSSAQPHCSSLLCDDLRCRHSRQTATRHCASTAMSTQRSRSRRSFAKAAITAIAIGCVVIGAGAISTVAAKATEWPEQDPAAAASHAASEPLSAPSTPDSSQPQSKFTRNAAMAIEDVIFGSDPSAFQRLNKCPMDIQLVWSNTLNTGVYASSVISHLYPDPTAGAQVIIPGFHRELNILDHDGHHIPGSPISMSSEVYFHSSPLLLDWNKDGIKDIVWVNVDAEVFVINGDPHADSAVLDYPFQLPKLKVKKRWYESLKPAAAPAAVKVEPESGRAGGARKLLSTDEDPSSPRAVMRKQKEKMWMLRRVHRKLKQQTPPTGRRLLQAKGKLGSRHRSRVAAKAAATRAAVKQPEPVPQDSQTEFDGGEEQEEEQPTNVDEPAALNTPLAVAPAAEVHAGNADVHLENLANKYAPGHGLDAPDITNPVDAEEEAFFAAYGRSLQMPEAPVSEEDGVGGAKPLQGGVGLVDDQEEDEQILEGSVGADGKDPWGRWWNDDEASQEQTGDAASDAPEPPRVPEKAGFAGTVPGGTPVPVDDRQLSDFSAEQIQAALDELMKEDPTFMDGLSETLELPPEAHPQATDDGAVDYAASIKALAEKFGKQDQEISSRQRSRQQHTDREDAQEAMETGAKSLPKTGIASKDAQLLEEYRRTQVPGDINSNVMRIIGDDSGALPASDPLNDLLAEQALLDSQVADGLPEEARESLNLFADIAGPSKLREIDPEVAWEMAELDRLYPVLRDEIWVDAHVLATPVLADLNGDDQPELIVSVSYFFDETDYANNPALLRRLGSDVDLKKYVGGGLVVIDLWSHKILWSEHLDLSTDDPHLDSGSKAFIYASPTVIDLDGDGGVEILVATSMGFIYGFNGLTHRLLPGFPLETRMAEIQSGIAVEDLNADGFLEMVVMDSRGNVLCFDHKGQEVWSALISGFASQAATFGDVDGNGILDVVVGTVSGHVWVLDGATGKSIPNFPLRTDGRIVAPITLVNMARPSLPMLGVSAASFARPGLHLIFPSFDGHVYIVDGRTGCTNKLDIGEHAYGMVLVADILGRGKADLLVTTMSGNVFCFATEVDLKDHPLRAWPSQHHGLNGYTAREGYQGVHFTRATRELLAEISGRDFTVEYVIVDERAKQTLASMSPLSPPPAKGEKVDLPVRVHYEIQFHFGGELVGSTVHDTPGVYLFSLSAGRIPQYTTVEIVMLNEHQQRFSDEFVVALNVHFYRIIKVRRATTHSPRLAWFAVSCGALMSLCVCVVCCIAVFGGGPFYHDDRSPGGGQEDAARAARLRGQAASQAAPRQPSKPIVSSSLLSDTHSCFEKLRARLLACAACHRSLCCRGASRCLPRPSLPSERVGSASFRSPPATAPSPE